MVTLISQNTSGKRRSCNARCYRAKLPKCVCICDGKNHSAGLEKAVDNTRDMAEQLLEKHCQVRIPLI